ncbi:alpha/beta fold hydrolase [Acidisphaera sp. L21]|jgi:pimeloyl-ACP methyl ester carboxylesterase|uniref:alpha/beta fold hydrolase n=1 Tax=Acidisphaera sp. L21 TaxID=1641851 RepID=UPI00131B0BE6|nr:alpha/beta hydrolase [Acidisphaera sp. L21]
MLIGAMVVLAVTVLAVGSWLYTPDESRASLEAKYAVAPSDFTDVLGVRFHIRDTGPRDAPAVIFLHGFGSSLQTWDSWAQGLDRDRRVIRFDLPGFGLTGADPSGDYSDPHSVALLVALMDRLQVTRASVVGNSMGGRIAWTFAASHPERVDKLVLISPDGFASPGLEYGVAQRVPLMVRALPYFLPKSMLRASLLAAYSDPAVMTDELATRYYDMMLAPGVRSAIVTRMAQQILVPPEPLLRQIKAPTLLMWGDRDAMIPPSNAADYLRALPNARLVSLPHMGHLPQEEAPQATLPALQAFLSQ